MESKLTRDDIALLDKLYNLRSDDSTILETIKKNIENETEQKKNTEDKQSQLEEDITSLTAKLDSLKEQLSKFVEDFKGYDRLNYDVLLNELDSDFDPQAIVKQVQEKSPEKIQNIEDTISTREKELTEVKETIQDSTIKLEELDREKEKANNNKENLDKLLSEILAGNMNITAQEITTLLNEFGFNKQEINSCGKMLLFSDSLAMYDDMIKEKFNHGKNITDILNEAKASAPTETIKSDDVIEETTPESLIVSPQEPQNTSNDDILSLLDINPEEVLIDFTKEETNGEKDEELTNIGLDIERFTKEDLEKIKNTDIELLKRNLDKFNEFQIDIYENTDLLVDEETVQKLNFLEQYVN